MRVENLKFAAALILGGLTAGCNGPKTPAPPGQNQTAPPEPPLKLVIRQGQTLPQELAGRWVANAFGWEFVLDPNQGIVSAILDNWRINMRPGQTVLVPMLEDALSTYEPGTWTLEYNVATRDLTLEIVLKRFHVELGKTQRIDGHSTDIFSGRVSDDFQRWPAQWVSFPKYQATTSNGSWDLPVNPEDTATDLVFVKVPEQK